MFKKKLLALLGGAMALTLLSTQPVLAQNAPEGRSQSDEASGSVRGERIQPGRLGRGDRAQENNNNQRQKPQRRPAEPTPEQNQAAAQTALTAAGVTCQVSEAKWMGTTTTEDPQSMYEAACASGPGYIVVASTPPQTFNCLELASQAYSNRARDPAAEVGQQCALPANQNGLAVTTAYAREVGIDCTIDEGSVIGRLDGNIVYEVGCANADGYQLEQKPTGWSKVPCWARALEGATCRYTTADENLAAWKAVLSSTDAAACTVQEARRVGADAQGLAVYEVKCGADEGFFVRVNQSTWAAERVHACADAAHIAGGCTLTTAAPAAATSEQ